MRTCFSMDPLTVDPRKCGDLISSAFVCMLFDGLTHALPNGEVELSLADSVEISEDGMIYLFRLKKALWSDGNPLTAFDFEHSWKKSLDPSFGASFPQLFYPIKNAEAASLGSASIAEVGVKALDSETLRVELEQPTPYFLSLVSCFNFFPVPRRSSLGETSWDPRDPSRLVCSGPFKLNRWEPKKEIALKINPLHWDAAKTHLESVHISIVQNEYTALEMFEAGDLDWVSSILAPLPLSSLKSYQDQKKLIPIPAYSTVFCAFNMHQFPFHNENIRKGLSMAIDRDLLVREVTQLNETAAKRFIPPGLGSCRAELLPQFNPELARRHFHKGLEELGIYKNGDDLKLRLFLENFNLSYVDALSNRQVAQSLQGQISRHLGYRLKLIPQTFKAQTESIYRRDFQIALKYFFPHFNDPMSLLERFKYKNLTRNIPHFESESYIDLLNQSSKCKFSSPQRAAYLLQAEAHLLDKMPIAPLYHGHHHVLSQPTITGITYNAIGNAQFKRARFVPADRAGMKTAVS